MPDTRRELSALQTLLADNTAGDISAQDARDELISAHPAKQHQTSAFASPPSDPVTGDVWMPSDGVCVYRYSGTAWVPWGPVFPFIEPSLQTWSWVNQGSATVGTTNGGIYLECVSNGTASIVRGRFKTAPSAPYVISTAFMANLDIQTGSYGFAGLAFRDSGTGKLVCPWFEWNSATADAKFRVYKFDDPSTPNADYTSGFQGPFQAIAQLVFMQIGDDNTNLYCKISADGQNWIQLWSSARTNFLATPNSVGFIVNPYASKVGMTLLHWKEA